MTRYRNAVVVCALALVGSACGNSAENPSGSGGLLNAGGFIGSGGLGSSGGTTATGGSLTTGGMAGTGGVPGTGGELSTGGEAVTGGTVGSGGEPGTGGTVGSGGELGTGGSGPVTGCRAPEQNASSGNSCYGGPPEALKFTEVASGLDEPTLVTHAPGDPSRLFVLERAGRIRLIKDGVVQPSPFLDLSARTAADSSPGERGLLGLAFDPDYETTGRFWLDYSKRGSGATVIESFTANADRDSADSSSGTVLFEVPQPASNHNGGMLAFGPDRCLYIAMGDGGGSNDTYGNSQDDSNLLGSMLRIDVDNYSEQQGAPGNVLTNPHLWSYGLRNPWRFSFDRATGDMYIGDVGQRAWEEVNVEPRGVAGLNYGWPCFEGTATGPKPSGCDGDYVPPVAEQPNGSTQNQSVIGGYVYRGTAIPSMVGRYVYADYNSRKIWSFTWQGDGNICDEIELTDQLQTGGYISSFGEDADGELYVVVYSSGRILKIESAAP